MANFGKRITQGIFRSSSPPAKQEASEDEKVEAYLAKWMTEGCTSLAMGGLGLTRFPPQLLKSSTLEELVFDDNEISSFPSFAPVAQGGKKGRKSKFRTSTLVKFGKNDSVRERRRTMSSARPPNFPAISNGVGDNSGTAVVIGYRKLATSLHTLILSRNQITRIDGGFKEALCLFSVRLKKLDLSQNPIEDPVAMLEFISKNLGSLQSLNVSRIDLRTADEKTPSRGPKWLTMETSANVKAAKKRTHPLSEEKEEEKEVKKHSSDPSSQSAESVDETNGMEEDRAKPGDAVRSRNSLSRSRSLSAGSLGSSRPGRKKGSQKEKAKKEEREEQEEQEKKEEKEEREEKEEMEQKAERKREDSETEEERKKKRSATDTGAFERKRRPKTEPAEEEKQFALLEPCSSPLCLITCGETVTVTAKQEEPKDRTAAQKREARKSMCTPTSMRKNSRGKRRSLSSSTEYKATKLQRNLRELSIKECHLSGFPTHLPKLTVLSRLDLSYNFIHALPEEIGMMKSLTHLTLIACSCTLLPASLGKLTDLEELYLDFNSIKTFPVEAAAGLVNLRQLFMPNNNLTEIPKHLVDLEANTCLPRLEFLDLNGNPIGEEHVKGTALDEQPWMKVGPPPGAPEDQEAAIVRFTRYSDGKIPSCILEPEPEKGLGGLYLGCGLCAQNKHGLRDLGIKSVLTMARGMAPVYPVEFSYMNVEVEDAESESIDKHLEKVITFIETSRNLGGVLVHCSAGVSRSSSVVIAYLMQHKGMSYDEAHQHVLERRPIVRPNPGFVQQLRLFEKALNSKEQCHIM